MPAFVAAIQVVQASTGASYSVQDTSNYDDLVGGKSAISSRVLNIYYSDGTLQTYTPTPFSYTNYPSDILTIDGQTADYALRIDLILTPVSPDSANTYTSSAIYTLTANMLQFLYGISQQIQADPSVLNIPNYWQNFMAVYSNYKMATIAGYRQDQSSAQAAINRFNAIANNSTIFFQ